MTERISSLPSPEFDSSRRYEHYSDAEALRHLEGLGVANPEFAFTVKEEKDSDGESIDADILWTRLKRPEGDEFHDCASVEGKLYLPRNQQKGELIIFTPGFPGGNAGRFEQRYAKTFVDAGFAFFTVRHNGTNLVKKDTAPEVLNNAHRMELARANGEEHIGGTRKEGYGMSDIAREPVTPLLALQEKFDRIHLMGQSMGVAASYHTVTRMKARPEVLKKIGNIIGISGYVGKEEDGPGDVWDGMKMPTDDLIAYELGYVRKVGTNAIDDPKRFREDMQNVARLNKDMRVPQHVGNVLVFTPGDPLIAGPDKTKEDFLAQYGPRTNKKLIIRDESTLSDPKQHSMLWIAPENLLRAVDARISAHGPHYIKIPRSGEGNILEKG